MKPSYGIISYYIKLNKIFLTAQTDFSTLQKTNRIVINVLWRKKQKKEQETFNAKGVSDMLY